MKMFWIVLILGAHAISCFAQIILTSKDVMNLIGTYQTFTEDISDAPIPVDVGSAGENQTWDFSNVTFPSEQFTQEYIVPQGTPYFDEFPTANLAGKMSFMIDTLEILGYTYLEVTENRLTFLGSGIDFLGVVEIESDNDFAPLPLTYGTQWMITRYDTMGSNSAFTTVQVETVLAKIDGWGTVSVPTGTFECLRLQTNWTEDIHTIVDDVIISTKTTVGSDFSWLSKVSMDLAGFNFNAPNYADAVDLKLLIEMGPTHLENTPPVIHQFVLKQNYPNPFNPKTIINYELPTTLIVDLSIYNVLGQKVVTLVSRSQNAGHHQVEWDASGFAGGVYYYRLQTSTGSVQTRKLVFLK